MRFKPLQQDRVLIRDAVHYETPIMFKACQWFRRLFGHSPVYRRYAMPMGIEFRMSEFRGDAFFETLGDEMFKSFCLLVDFFDRVIEDVIKKSLD